MGQGDDRLHDGRARAVGADGAHKGAIDLQGFDRHPVQVTEGRVAGAEVVEMELHAGGAQGG